ncbi:MAG TPA: response regulator [Candidatus Saccharimonadia bacterium]|nr:response regulator [Candidatus Saccharimonadia bacterium]
MAKTILIAEDEPSLLKLLSKKVRGLGFNVVTAEDGEQTIEVLKSQPVDLLLLDIIMPRKNGLQVLQELRVNLGSKIPVFILSNLEKNEDIEAGKAYGVKEYIVKSQVSMRQLGLQIAQALQEAGA